MGEISHAQADAILAELSPRRGSPLEHLKAAHAAAFGESSAPGTLTLLRMRTGEAYHEGAVPWEVPLRVAKRLGSGGFFDPRHAVDAAEKFHRHSPGATEAQAVIGLVEMLAAARDHFDADPAPEIPLTADERRVRVALADLLPPDADPDEWARRVNTSINGAWLYTDEQFTEAVRLATARAFGG